MGTGILARLLRPRVTIFDRLLLMLQGVVMVLFMVVMNVLSVFIGFGRLGSFVAWISGHGHVHKFFRNAMSFRNVVKFYWRVCFVGAWNLKVKQGSLAYNANLIRGDDGQACKLLDFQTEGRPLVVFFASCTCPFAVRMLEQLSAIIQSHKDRVNFLIVYTAEAHASDGWKMENLKHNVASHRSLQERMDAAKILKQYNIDCSVVVDLMTDTAAMAYGTAPTRLYLLEDGIVKRQSRRGPMGFDANTLRGWLDTRK